MKYSLIPGGRRGRAAPAAGAPPRLARPRGDRRRRCRHRKRVGASGHRGRARRGGRRCGSRPSGRGSVGSHQRLDLRPRQRTRQVRHGPARLEDHRGVVVHVVHQEHALAQAGQRLLHRLAVERRGGARGHALQPLEHALLVALGLQPADEPGAGVGEALVVQVHRVLRGQHHAHAERPGLLEQRQQRRLRRRVRHRREVAEDLVHVDDGPQAAGAGLRPHPAQHLVQQQRHEEHALRVVQMGDREDRDARLALRREQQAADVERLALQSTPRTPATASRLLSAIASSNRSLAG